MDTLGLIRSLVWPAAAQVRKKRSEVEVTAADVGDRDGLKRVLTSYFAPGVQRLRKLWVDGGYTGADLNAWVADLKKTPNDLEVVAKEGTLHCSNAVGWLNEPLLG